MPRSLRTRLRGRALLAALAVVLIGGPCLLTPRSTHAQSAPPPPPPPPESNPTAPPPPPPPEEGLPPAGTAPTPGNPGTPAPPQNPPTSSGGRYLMLPDISLNGFFLGHLSNDRRDQDRDRIRLGEAELAIQSYVYPDIRLDTFFVFDGGGETTVEEAFLTYQNLPIAHLPMSGVLGRRKVPFGRVNQLHPHSWLYAVQPYVLTNLVSEESLTGDGGYISYLLPTGKIFTQFEAGIWNLSEASEDLTIGGDPTQEIIGSSGAGFRDKFGTARLLVASEVFGGSLELGGSLAGGRGVPYSLVEDGPTLHPKILLSGLDFTYRHAGSGTSRLLLRGEYIHHQQKDGGFKNNTDGYYLFADQRLDAFRSIAVRYDSSGFPYADGRVRGISLIGTQQLTETTLYRLQYIHGDRPGKRNFDEFYVSIIFGVGPHTHNLE